MTHHIDASRIGQPREPDHSNWMDADGPLRRITAKRLLVDPHTCGIIRLLQEHYHPKDVLVQQRKVASAQALVFIAPVYFVRFPAMLKGWIERAFGLRSASRPWRDTASLRAGFFMPFGSSVIDLSTKRTINL